MYTPYTKKSLIMTVRTPFSTDYGLYARYGLTQAAGDSQCSEASVV